jgi:multidrug resistance protein
MAKFGQGGGYGRLKIAAFPRFALVAQGEKVSKRVLSILFAIVFLDLVGFGIVIPLLPLYAEQYRPAPWLFGLLMSSFSIMQFLFAPILGGLSDRLGRRPVLLISLAGSILGYLFFAFANSLAMLFAARIVAGMAGGNVATAQAVIADVTEKDKRTAGMGLVGAAFGLGFIAGPALSGLLLPLSPRLPGLVAALFSLAAWLATWFFLPETRRVAQDRRAWSPLAGAGILGPALFVTLLVVTGWAGFEVTFAQFLHGAFSLPAHRVAWLFAYLGFLAVLVQGLLVRRLPSSWPARNVLVAGLAFSFVGLLLLARASAFWQVLLVLPLLALGQGLVHPSLSAWVSQRAPAFAQGQALGAYQAASSVARILGPFLGELALGHWGLAAPSLGAAGLAFLAAFLALAVAEP